jgi:hypothetical protein
LDFGRIMEAWFECQRPGRIRKDRRRAPCELNHEKHFSELLR